MTDDAARETSTPVVARRFSRRYFLRLGTRAGIASGVLGFGTLAEARTLEPSWLEVSRHRVVLPHLPRAFDGFTIAHITDLHADDATCSYSLERVCELTNAQNADAILITGDFSSNPLPTTIGKLVPGLSKLRAGEGVFGIMGNHDHWNEGPEYVRQALRQSGVKELCNAVHEVKRDGQSLWLCGIDDFWQGNPDLHGVAAQVPPGSAAVVMGHEPDFADEVAPYGKFGLMLSGHSHGGQISMPFIGPISLPRYCWKYPRGRYEVKGMTLYTNRGIGTVDLPLRFCARPEIAVFTLVCA